MNPNEERTLAQKYGAKVIGFNQADNLCRGYVAWWLRRELKAKVSGKQSKFFKEPLFEKARSNFKGDRYMLAEEKGSRPEQLATLFNPPANLPLMHRYITTGYCEQLDPGKNLQKERVEVAKPPVRMENEKLTKGAIDQFMKYSWTHDKGAVVYWSVSCPGELDHAVGLTFLDRPVLKYFDPGLGEFTFTESDAFVNWWWTCYEDRKTGGSAFSNFLDSFGHWTYLLK